MKDGMRNTELIALMRRNWIDVEVTAFVKEWECGKKCRILNLTEDLVEFETEDRVYLMHTSQVYFATRVDPRSTTSPIHKCTCGELYYCDCRD